MVSVLAAVGLAAIGTGAGRLTGVLPLAVGLACQRRLAACAPLPDSVGYDPATGWSLGTGEERVAVRLAPESWFGRRLVLAAFHDDDGRRWLVPLGRPRGESTDEWRRLRVLWRTRRAALVANSPNC